jgi:hypothetical protein
MFNYTYNSELGYFRSLLPTSDGKDETDFMNSKAAQLVNTASTRLLGGTKH